ncbi:hypothetical protein ARMSODRAFT_1004798 [Armillaria solidipes]|uniref:Uncharacterized protein n=1 Tax=Armillaria solidipes TaxID=1076256 RepID=A0A2H3BFN6_9AGAR|nr:hypothetical protein ARMSODRAFT_1004798 [Armillaria solidipes]
MSSGEQTTSPRSPSRVSRCFAITLSFLVIVPALCLTLSLTQNSGGELPYITNANLTDGANRTVDLVSADLPQSTMLVDWSISEDNCRLDCPAVNIFFDTNNRPTNPIFIWNNTARHDDPLRNVATFRTKHIIGPVYQLYIVQYNLIKMISYGTLSHYPFDSYASRIFTFAEETLTNKPVSLAILSLSRSLADFKITIVNNYNSSDLREIFGQEVIVADVMLQRSTLVIGYCLVITIICCSVFLLYSMDFLSSCISFIWIGMVTLMICLIMITTVVFGYRQRNEIVVVSIGTLFAFTQLRSSMPGAPEGFDFAGLLPCLVLLSICTHMIRPVKPLFGTN